MYIEAKKRGGRNESMMVFNFTSVEKDMRLTLEMRIIANGGSNWLIRFEADAIINTQKAMWFCRPFYLQMSQRYLCTWRHICCLYCN